MRENVRRAGVVALAAVAAGWMLVDGTRAMLVGDYFTVGGELGPWAPLVEAIGIPARSLAMKAFFVLYGGTWLATTALFLLRRASARTMAAFALGSVWYLVFGTLSSVAQIAILWPILRAERVAARKAHGRGL